MVGVEKLLTLFGLFWCLGRFGPFSLVPGGRKVLSLVCMCVGRTVLGHEMSKSLGGHTSSILIVDVQRLMPGLCGLKVSCGGVFSHTAGWSGWLL